ncbi:hypothetical protein SAMN05660652_03388 [Propionivibrio dicarboxylicus]|uniref:Uncharacterized protein n=1 Tax=Propionivibrio dicarboxylicus TaxID=83767 RepID=A0A1G8KD73_9RHOO|nr:hypothetical protein SAMN05660652_03388 [Propionivibrio dicarboxylicus]
MPLSATLIASIVSAVLEAASLSATTPTRSPQQYESYVMKRKLPPEAKLGVMAPPAGNGRIVINGTDLALSPVAQFRNSQNLIVQPMTLQENQTVVYINDPFGAVFRVWMVSQAELSALQQN